MQGVISEPLGMRNAHCLRRMAGHFVRQSLQFCVVATAPQKVRTQQLRDLCGRARRFPPRIRDSTLDLSRKNKGIEDRSQIETIELGDGSEQTADQFLTRDRFRSLSKNNAVHARHARFD